MEQSPRLALSYLQPQQAQKHVTVNETFRRLDALVGLAVASRTTDAEPASPAEGEAYIMTAGASGAAWSTYDENAIAVYQDGAWTQISPPDGVRAYVLDEGALFVRSAGAWTGVGGASGAGGATLGVNTTADATNRLAVKSDAVLFSDDDVTPGAGDMRLKLSKAAAGNTASIIFQNAFSGRAEMGLTGDDDFRIKVSPDNFTTSFEALFIDKDNGRVGLGETAPEKKLHITSPDNNDGFVLETTDTTTGRVGFDLVTQQSANAGDYFRFNFRGDRGDVVLTAWDQSAAAFIGWLTFDYLANTMSVTPPAVFGSPTGGAKGAGSINAQAVYDDNTLLSCYVFDQAIDGRINKAKWDAKVPDRIHRDAEGRVTAVEKRAHEPMHRFAARAGGEHDPLTLDGYAKHWREKRHLTSMPDETAFDPEKGMPAGAWIQRLVETVEIQAVLIEQLNQRVKAFESR